MLADSLAALGSSAALGYRIAGYIGGNNVWQIARKRKKIAIGGYKFGGYGTIATPSPGVYAILYWRCDKIPQSATYSSLPIYPAVRYVERQLTRICSLVYAIAGILLFYAWQITLYTCIIDTYCHVSYATYMYIHFVRTYIYITASNSEAHKTGPE